MERRKKKRMERRKKEEDREEEEKEDGEEEEKEDGEEEEKGRGWKGGRRKRKFENIHWPLTRQRFITNTLI